MKKRKSNFFCFFFSSSFLRLNGAYKSGGSGAGSDRWPTLGEAVAANERIFVFVRSKFVGRFDRNIVREDQVPEKKHWFPSFFFSFFYLNIVFFFQIDIKRPYHYPFRRGDSAVVLSSFKSRLITLLKKYSFFSMREVHRRIFH